MLDTIHITNAYNLIDMKSETQKKLSNLPEIAQLRSSKVSIQIKDHALLYALHGLCISQKFRIKYTCARKEQ